MPIVSLINAETVAGDPLSGDIIEPMKARLRTRYDISRQWPVVLVIASISLAASPPARAQSAANSPVQAVKATIDEATPVFENPNIPAARRTEELHAIAKKHFDFPYMARESLGVHWRTLTSAQRAQYVPLFTNYVIDTFLSTLQQSTVQAVSHSLTGTATMTSPGYAEVHSLVKLPSLSQPLKVDYRVRKEGGTWKIFDITIDNVSQMGNYRRDFSSVINRNGYPALINDLKEKKTLTSTP